MEKEKFSYPVSLRRMQITDKFWKNEMELVRTEVIPYQWNALNDKVEAQHQVIVCIILKWQQK